MPSLVGSEMCIRDRRVWCGAQHFQRHLWEFVAFFRLNCSASGLTTTFGYSPLGIAFHPRGFISPVILICLPLLPRFSTSPAHTSCGNLYALSASTPPPFPPLYPSIISVISRLHLLYAVRLNLSVPFITFHFSTSSSGNFVEGDPCINIILRYVSMYRAGGTRGKCRRAGASNDTCTGTYFNQHRPLTTAAEHFGGTYMYHFVIRIYVS